MLQIRVIRLDVNRTFANCSNRCSSYSFVIFCLPHIDILTQTFMVPWQEPWAGDIYSGSWMSIGPARIQIKGSVTHQPYKGKQIFKVCAGADAFNGLVCWEEIEPPVAGGVAPRWSRHWFL